MTHYARALGPALITSIALALSVLVVAALVAPVAQARKLTAANWNVSQQRSIVALGVMTSSPSGFSGAAALTGQAADEALTAAATRLELPAPAPTSTSTGATITVTQFDALLVDGVGLGDVATHVEQVARAAGLRPPSYFGTEVLARSLGLRYDHPAGEDSLELYPSEAITRAEGAHSFAELLHEGGWALEAARGTFEAFSLPHYDADQLRVLRIAVSKIGMPYVWGGTTDDTADGLEHGGYDCSGFAWRVYKVSGLPWGADIRGRTAAEQAGEIPRSARVPLAEVEPADLLFFGSARLHSKTTASNVDHEGIALSGEWAIHSSGQGVYVLPLDSGWLAQQFSWARRVL
ncbi:MAG TPA: NlpC/P60 family protein [Solirubrobacteraceae bacterium]|jgi:cell wall-associated NlpC family hydrolase|nr:NlpC/P60 family protein [Solirubrobacteraceae bacterium]